MFGQFLFFYNITGWEGNRLRGIILASEIYYRRFIRAIH